MLLVIWNGLIQLEPETFVSSVFGNLLLRFILATAEVENKEQDKSQACASPQVNPHHPLPWLGCRGEAQTVEEQGPELQHQRPWQAPGSSA